MRRIEVLIWYLLCVQICLAQVRDPSETSTNSKYRSKDPKSVEEVLFGIDTTKHGAHECHYNVDIIYQNELLSDENTLVPPIITDLHASGERDLVFATLNSAHLINGRTGELQRGQWPLLMGDTNIYSQPLLYDINEDGVDEIIITTNNGEIVFIDLFGNPLIGQAFKVPKLRVRKDWYTGLDTDDVDAFYSLKEHEDSDAEDENNFDKNEKGQTIDELNDEGFEDWLEQQRQEMVELINTLKDELTEEGIKSLDLLLSSRDIKHNDQDELFYSVQYENYLKENPAAVKVDAKYLHVDAHVMATPIIADLNRNGQYYLIAPVSYYFDDSEINSPRRRNEFIGVYPQRYIASGVVAFNLKTKTIAWTTHLDLTTDKTEYRGYMLSSPVAADLNGDGRLEVLVTTAVGFVYVLEADGTWNKQFSPESMSSIYASPLVDDFNNDGALDILVVDDKGNVVLFNDKGAEIWENTIAGTTLYNPMSGDINGDGILDVVILTEEGIVWALQGNNGQTMKNFPVKLGGQTTQPILLPIKGNNTLDIIFFTDDGHLYIIDGGSGCFETIDLGEEESMGFVLADDIKGNGKMDLLLTTLNSFALLETQMDYDPIWAWKTSGHSSGPITGNRFGVRISKELKSIKNIVGRDFSLYFDIVDNRRHIRPPSYNVRIFNGAKMLGEFKYTSPGQQKIKMTSPNIHHETLIRIEVMNEFGQVAFDEFAVSFNAHFDRDFAWIVVIPFLGMCFVLLFVKEMKSLLPV